MLRCYLYLVKYRNKGVKKMTKARENEIIDACAKLYESMSFKEITIKKIGDATSFTRTSIYNYYQTKEEIFLSLLKREYDKWSEDLNSYINSNKEIDKAEFADILAHSLEKRKTMLRLVSMNLSDIEENSRLQNLVEFKISYGKSVNMVRKCLDKFCRNMSDDEKDNFIFIFFPFIYGIYPYSTATQKQRDAMAQAKINYTCVSIYEIALTGIKKLLDL